MRMKINSWISMLVTGLLGIAIVACGGAGPDCRVGADCASGICLSDGTCALVEEDGSDGGGDQEPDGADGTDSDPDGSDGNDGGGDDPLDGGDDDPPDGGDDDPPDGGDDDTCAPVLDEKIERHEVPFGSGMRANYAVSGLTDVDTAGQIQADESRVWDLSGELEGDHLVLVETLDPLGAWWAPDFPGATYASRLRDDEDLLGVFQATDSALLLLGVVSPDDGLTRTRLEFDPPVEVLSFPLELGHAWSSDSSVSGLALGVLSYYSEDYDSQVDALGSLSTPFGEFPVLRVRTVLTRTVGLVATRVRTFMFVTECFGTVAVIHSRDNETDEEFTQASEVRRLAL